MPLPALSFYRIDYEPAPPMLHATSLRTLSAEEMTESAELMLEAARQYNCPYWLLDGRRHERPQPRALHYWMQEEYFPRVWAALGQQICVAFLALPAGQLPQAEHNDTTLQEWQMPAVRMGWFVEEAPARAWLNRLRPQ